MKVNKYNDFILNNEFNSIIENILIIVESEGKWLDDNTYVWDLKDSEEDEEEDKSPTFKWDLTKTNSTKSKLEKFLSKIPKDKIRKYFYKFLEKLKLLPSKIRKNLLIIYSSVFLSITSIGYLTNVSDKVEEELFNNNKDLVIEVVKLNKKSSFKESQSLVKSAEGGYSSDKKDRGNYVKTKWGKRFVGTNHGISAPILMEYLGRIPTQDDMKNLTYEEALLIYKI